MKPLRLVRSARQELHEAVLWYERARPGLGRELFGDVRELLGRIRREPSSFPKWREGRAYRKAVLVSRFPFTVFFEELEREVRVHAVAHARRRPGYWVGRTRGGQ